MYSFLLENILRYVTNQQQQNQIKNPIPKQNTQSKYIYIYNQKQNEQISKSSANLSLCKEFVLFFDIKIQAAIN